MLAAPIHPDQEQLARLEALLPRWRQVPLYRGPLGGCGLPGLGCFQQLPLLGKPAMRENFPHNFLQPELSLEMLLAEKVVELEHTSGTTSERLPVIFARGWWDEQEQRALRLNPQVAQILAAQPEARRATLTAPNCNGFTCPTGWMPLAQRIIGRSLFVNLARIPFLLAEAELARMAAEILEWEPVFLDTDPVHAVWFARYCERHGLRFPSLKFILCSYEFVSTVHKQILARVFGVPVFNLYGSTETGHLLMEDTAGAMVPSRETAFLELSQPDAAGIGDLVVTTLSNDFMPLLRYRIGDLAQAIPTAGGVRYLIHGRAKDALTDTAGARVTTWQVDQLFADMAGILHYELRQTGEGSYELRYIPDAVPPTADSLAELRKKLGELLKFTGTIPVTSLNTLVPAASGKFRLTCRTEPEVPVRSGN
ncbi:MAG TPA: hypothetical protein VF607_06455 [Verrucomicrobiae bacterium]